MSGEGDKQHGHMGDRAMIFRSRQADHRRSLHGDREKAGKDPLHRCPLIIDKFESPRSVSDLITNAGAQADEIVTALLVEELWMGGRAEKILPPVFLPPVKMATVLGTSSLKMVQT